MKKLLLLLFALPYVAMGQTDALQSREELRVIEKIFYDRGVYIASDEDMDRLNGLVFNMRADSTLKIHVVGYGDKWGGAEVNDRFSYVRAMFIAEWIRSCRVPREQIVYVGEGIDSLAVNDAEARRVDILQVVEGVIEPEPTPAPEPTQTPEPTPAPELTQTPEPTVEQTSAVEPMATTQSQQSSTCVPNFALRTNLLYWLTGMGNVGVEIYYDDIPFTLVLNGGYSPFGSKNGEYNLGGWFVAPEVRYYIPANPRWFVGMQYLAYGYNIKLSDTGSQGTLHAGGVIGGYKMPLSKLFEMDFTLGAGYGKTNYVTYTHSSGYNVYKERSVSKSSIFPIQAGVNLIWKIK